MSQKEALLHGKDHLEPVDLSGIGGPQEVHVRPLTAPEAGRIDSIRLGGLEAPVDLAKGVATATIDDLGKFAEQQRRARVVAVALGLSHSGETWTEEEAGNIPLPHLERLANVIFRISGMRAVEGSFRVRQDSGGPSAGR